MQQKSIRIIWDSAQSLDENLGKLVEKLKERGLYENTVIPLRFRPWLSFQRPATATPI